MGKLSGFIEEVALAEEWRPVVGWEDFYEVSSFGAVRSVSRQVTQGNRHGSSTSYLKAGCLRVLRENVISGYLEVMLKGGGRRKMCRVHMLVCSAFHGDKPTPLHEVAHGDGTRKNNRADNLRWATRTDNHLDKRLHGTAKKSPLSGETISNIRAMRAEGQQYGPIAAAHKISKATACRVCVGRNEKRAA